MLLKEFFSVPSVKDHNDFKEPGKHSDEEKAKLANDVFWFILDHDRLHKKYFMPVAQEMYVSGKNTDISLDEYTECWLPMVKKGCLEYHKEHKLKGNPGKIFDKEFCKEVCERIAEKHFEDVKKNAYKLGK